MASLSLPASPSDGDTVTFDGTKFTYNATAGRWTRELLSSRIETVVPSTNTSVTATSVSGNTLVFTQADGSTANVDLSSLSGGQVTTYANESDLPSDADNGSHGYVTATTFLYVKATSGWYKITSVNLTPSVTVSSSSQTFTAAAQSVDITYTVAEPEDTPVTVTVSNTGISASQLTTTHHASNNTLSIVSGSTALSGGTITISASDGVNIGTGTISIDVSLGVSWAGDTTARLITPGLGNSTLEAGDVGHNSGVSISGDGLMAIAGAQNLKDNAGGFVIWTNSSGDSANNNAWQHVHTQIGAPIATASDNSFSGIPVGASGTTWQTGNYGNYMGRREFDIKLSANGTVALIPWHSLYNNSYRDNASKVALYIMNIHTSNNSLTDHSSFGPANKINDTGTGYYVVNQRGSGTPAWMNGFDFDDDLNYLVYDFSGWKHSNNATLGKIVIVSRSGSTWTNAAEFTPLNTTLASTASMSYSNQCRMGASGAHMNSAGDKIVTGSPLIFQRTSDGGGKGGVFTFTRSGSTWSYEANGGLYDSVGGNTNFCTGLSMSKDGNYLAVIEARNFNGSSNPDNTAQYQTGVNDAGVKIYLWNSITKAWDYQTKIKPSDDATPPYEEADGISVVRLNKEGTVLAMLSVSDAGPATSYGQGVYRIYKRSGTSWTLSHYHYASDNNWQADGIDYFSDNSSTVGPDTVAMTAYQPSRAQMDHEGRNIIHAAQGNFGNTYSNSKNGDALVVSQST